MKAAHMAYAMGNRGGGEKEKRQKTKEKDKR